MKIRESRAHDAQQHNWAQVFKRVPTHEFEVMARSDHGGRNKGRITRREWFLALDVGRFQLIQ